MTHSANAPLNRRIGLFDSDCLEVADEKSRRSQVLRDFGIRERMQPHAEKLDRLYAFAERHDLVMVFTHCCSARRAEPGAHPDVLVVPMDESDSAWMDQVDDYRLINIEKIHDAPLHESFICRHFDSFQHNRNAALLFQRLNIPLWVAFGHGLDLCVDTAIKGIVVAGYQVHLLTDVIASSATGYGPYGTEDSKKAILGYLGKIGVTMGTLAEFLMAYGRTPTEA